MEKSILNVTQGDDGKLTIQYGDQEPKTFDTSVSAAQSLKHIAKQIGNLDYIAQVRAETGVGHEIDPDPTGLKHSHVKKAVKEEPLVPEGFRL